MKVNKEVLEQIVRKRTQLTLEEKVYEDYASEMSINEFDQVLFEKICDYVYENTHQGIFLD